MALDKLTRLHADLGERYDRLQDALLLDDADLAFVNPQVSAWSVANQLHHTASSTALMLVGVERIAAMKQPAEEGGSISAIGRAVLMTRRFPRGKGKAPSRTVPPEVVTREELEQAISRSREVYDRLPDSLDRAATSSWRVKHPYFGWLDASQWLKLASVHADHHFSIIRDIQA